jgi:hypothetical protein
MHACSWSTAVLQQHCNSNELCARMRRMLSPCPTGDYQGKINIWGLFTGERKSSVAYRCALL